MVTSNDLALSEKIQQLRDHGAVVSDLQRHLGPQPYLLADHIHAGYNQSMTDIQVELGNKQMDRAAEIVKERQRLAANYIDELRNVSQLSTPNTPDGWEHGYQSFACMFQPQEITKGSSLHKINEARNKFMAELQARGISTRPATHAVHMLSYYKDKYQLKSSDYPKSQIANDCSISLPLFHGMTSLEQEYVIDVVKQILS